MPSSDLRASSACLNSVEGSNVSQMPIGSCYTSATTLVQKAIEIGAKISDNSITPILLIGFTGYSTSNMSSIAQEGSLVVGNK